MAEAMLGLAAVGVDVLRLDAVPFLWKRMGTNCQNQPEVHELLQALPRGRCGSPRRPSRFKAEAIVAPARPRRLPRRRAPRGHGVRPRVPQRPHGPAVERAGLAAASRCSRRRSRSMPPVPPGAGWLTYVRCHDDIGWAITDEDAGAVGEDAHLHRRFLTDFYAGDFPGSFARGARFQPEPQTGEARISGTAASLAGLEAARRAATSSRGARAAPHPAALRRGVRLRRAAADLHGRRARPAQRPAWADDPRHAGTTTAGCTARRWTGRPPSAATTRRTVEGRLWAGLRGWSPRGAPRAPSTRRARPSRCGRATTTSSACCAARPASACCCWPNFTAERQSIGLAAFERARARADRGRRAT